MGLYSRYVLPKFINWGCGTKPVRYQRRKVVPLARGTVLEIGVGSGLNLPFYDADRVDYLYGLEPASEMIDLAQPLAADLPFKMEFLQAGAEDIPLERESVDTVLVTYTLCTLPEVVRSLVEMRRVLKPDGILIFCEHGLADDASVVRWQNRINPLWRKLAGGCNLNRDIPQLLQDGGFAVSGMETMYLPGTPRFAGYNYWGTATAV